MNTPITDVPSSQGRDNLDRALDALERVIRMFAIERFLYLAGAAASLVLFLFAGYRMFSGGVMKPSDMTLIFGASGVSAACSGRVALFLNRAFKIIETIVQHEIGATK